MMPARVPGEIMADVRVRRSSSAGGVDDLGLAVLLLGLGINVGVGSGVADEEGVTVMLVAGGGGVIDDLAGAGTFPVFPVESGMACRL